VSRDTLEPPLSPPAPLDPGLLDPLEPADLLAAVLGDGRRAALSCSFQAGGIAVLHMARRIDPDIPVVFVDTGYHFPETIAFRDRLVADWNLNLVVAAAGTGIAEHEAELGELWRTDPDRCCGIRKVDPLYAALAPYDVWITGLRRDQAATRAATRLVERKLLPTGHVVDKVNPIARWTVEDLQTYVAIHDIPVHPLHDAGYPSIGCAPCTAPADPSDPRAGRWGGAKIECGLHTAATDVD